MGNAIILSVVRHQGAWLDCGVAFVRNSPAVRSAHCVGNKAG